MEEKVSEEDFRYIDMGKYAEDYSDDGLWDKIRDNVTSIGLTLLHSEKDVRQKLLTSLANILSNYFAERKKERPF